MTINKSSNTLVLDTYEINSVNVWCWKQRSDEFNEELASQEFDSEQLAMQAMREDKLVWSKLSDLGN
jgi:hypothetical protein